MMLQSKIGIIGHISLYHSRALKFDTELQGCIDPDVICPQGLMKDI